MTKHTQFFFQVIRKEILIVALIIAPLLSFAQADALETQTSKTNILNPSLISNQDNSEIAFLGIGEEPLLLLVVNETGQTILTTEASETQRIDMKDFPKGDYYFRFSNGVDSFYRKMIL